MQFFSQAFPRPAQCHRYQQKEKMMSNDVIMFDYFMKQITMQMETAQRTWAVKYQFRIYNAII